MPKYNVEPYDDLDISSPEKVDEELRTTVPSTSSPSGYTQTLPTPSSMSNSTQFQPPSENDITLYKLNDDNYSVRIKWLTGINKVHDRNLVTLDSADPLVENEVTINAVNWSGNQIGILEIKGQEINGSLSDDYYLVQSINSTVQQVLVFDMASTDFLAEYVYILDPVNQSYIGIYTNCEELSPSHLGIILGKDNLIIRCKEKPSKLNISDRKDYIVYDSFILPPLNGENLLWGTWINSDEAVFHKGFGPGVGIQCMYLIGIEHPICKDLEFWMGIISSNGDWVEVRIGDNHHRPNQVGRLSLDCFRDPDHPCQPELVEIPVPYSEPAFQKSIVGAAWDPRGQRVYYLAHEGPGPHYNWPAGYEGYTDIYMVDYYADDHRPLTRIPGQYYTGALSFGAGQYYWHPDGRQLLLWDGQDYFLFDVESLTLRPFFSGGIVLGEIDFSSGAEAP